MMILKLSPWPKGGGSAGLGSEGYTHVRDQLQTGVQHTGHTDIQLQSGILGHCLRHASV